MTYQKRTGALMANSHPGSYSGQDAYNDMLVTERERKRETMDNLLDAEVRRVHGEPDGINDVSETIQVGNGSDSDDYEYAVRRLTPTECARLQGFPPDWCDDVPHSDSAEYKLWGNGIALPCLLPMMKAMADLLKGDES